MAKKKTKKRTKKRTTKKKSLVGQPLNDLLDKQYEKISARPLDDRVVIRVDDAATLSPGGIILIQSAQEQSQFGTVVAVGPGAPWKERAIPLGDPMLAVSVQRIEGKPDRLAKGPRFPMCVEPGDRVMIGRYGGAPLEIDGKEYTIIRESDILAVVE